MSLRNLIFFVFLLTCSVALSQETTKTFLGNIVDSNGHPINIATVQIENTNIVSVTDKNGFFKLSKVPKLPFVLSVLHLNYQPKKITITKLFSNQRFEIVLQSITQQLQDVVVFAEKPRLTKDRVEVFKGIPIKIEEAPYFVQSLNAKLFESTASTNLVEALQNANGFTFNANTYNNLFARGFPLSPSNYLLDGQQGGTTGINSAPQVLYNLEEIQVIKGPSAAINGNAQPGALLNLITKKPSSYNHVKITARGGSYNFYEGIIDVNQVLKKHKLDARLIAAYQNTNSFMKFNSNENIFLAPSLNWKLNEKTNLLISGTYLNREGLGGGWHHRGIVAIDGNLDRVPLSWTSHEKRDNTMNEAILTQLQLDTEIGDNYELVTQIRYQKDDFSRGTHVVVPYTFDNDTNMMDREYQETTQSTSNFYINSYLHKDFDFGGLHLHTILGLDFASRNDNRTAKFYRGNVSGLNIDNPVYGNTNTNLYELNILDVLSEEPINSYGIYLQSNQRWSERLMTMFSFRLNNTDQSSNTIYNLQDRTVVYDNSVTAFNPTIGITYKAFQNTNLYANYSTGFQPQFAYSALVNFDSYAQDLEPEKTYQIESGIKQELFNKKVLLTIAGYYIEKSNILGIDPNYPDVSIPINSAISRGIEASFSGRIKEFEFIVNYAYNNLRIENSGSGAVFHNSVNNPEHNFNVWATQEFDINKVNLRLGLGSNYWSERNVNSGELTLPDFATADALINFNFSKVNVTINFNNIFNKRYYTGGSSQFIIFSGQPFNAQLSLSYLL